MTADPETQLPASGCATHVSAGADGGAVPESGRRPPVFQALTRWLTVQSCAVATQTPTTSVRPPTPLVSTRKRHTVGCASARRRCADSAQGVWRVLPMVISASEVASSRR